MLKPSKEGVDHINAYSKSKTVLGEWLSNFTYEPIETEDGDFQSIEGYWYWLGQQKHQELRYVSGYQAKRIGRNYRLPTKEIPIKEFKSKIKKAFKLKINSNKKMKKAFIKSKLPITHYYVDPSGRLIFIPKHYWLFKFMNKYRTTLQRKVK